MILRLLITAMLLLGIAKYYLHDTKQVETIKPKQQIENVQKQLDGFNQKAAEQKEKALKELGL